MPFIKDRGECGGSALTEKALGYRTVNAGNDDSIAVFLSMEAHIDPIAQLVSSVFGIPYLYPYQRLVIGNILDAMETAREEKVFRQLVLLPTGSGKSLCFQLPSLLIPGLTLIVYPLLGLIADQHRRLEERGIKSVTLKGGMKQSEREAVFKACLDGQTRLILANPEILITPDCLAFLEKAKIGHFVIDEAHCVAEWGDSFRPAYLELARPMAAARPRVVTAFTATASPSILKRIAELLFDQEPYGLIAGQADRPNIHYTVLPSISMRHTLRQTVMASTKPLIVFVQSRKAAELLAEDLHLCFPHLDSRFYHAGLEKAERTELESWFLHTPDGILCATCAYGMGLDKADIRTVIHFGAPASVEAYLQEAGRAGRDGKDAEAILIAPEVPLEPKAATETLDPAVSGLEIQRRMRKKVMVDYASGKGGCRRSYLLTAIGGPGASETSCSGCDRCAGSAREVAEGTTAIVTALKRHPRRFNEQGLAAVLTDRPGPSLAPERGSLASWQEEEIMEALELLIRNRVVHKMRRGPWRGRMVLDRKSPLPPGLQGLKAKAQSGKSSSSGTGAFFSTGRVSGFFTLVYRALRLDHGSAI